PSSSTLFPYTTLFRSPCMGMIHVGSLWGAVHHPLLRTTVRIFAVVLLTALLTFAAADVTATSAPRFDDGLPLATPAAVGMSAERSEEHTSELQSRENL